MNKWKIIIIVMVMLAGFCLQAEEPQKDFSLKDAIYHALKNNLDLQVQLTDTQVSRKALSANKGIFIPQLELNGSMIETNDPSEGVLSGSKEISTRESQSLTLGISQQLPIGGTVQLQLYSSQTETNSIFTNPNPSLYSRATLSLSQPLLKGFGLTATKRQIYIAANNLKSSREQLRQQIINIVYTTEEAYWQLVYAYQNREATQMSLQRARDLLKQNEIKVRVGSAAPIEILSAKAEVARYESSLITAEKSIQTAQENLKSILNLSKEHFLVNPTDKPEIKKAQANLAEFLEEGLKNRPDIQQAKLDLANNNIEVKYAKNQTLPELSLNFSYYTTGRGGDLLVYAPGKSPILPDFNPDTDIIDVIKKDLMNSMDDVFSNLYRNYSVSLNLKMPLSFAKEKAELAQAKLRMKKALLNLKKVENTVYTEVKNVIMELESNAKLVDADKLTLDLNEQNLKAEEKKLSVGLSTNFQVLQYQKDLSQAQANYLQSVINYNMSLAKINKILARTFKSYDIKLDEYINDK